MSPTNRRHLRAHQQDARAWAQFTDGKYVAALRQVESPLAQGLLGERLSARRALQTLDDHVLIGAHGAEPLLGESGYLSDDGWTPDGGSDLVDLALVVDFLRMFTPLPAADGAGVPSYALKHSAERFLRPHCSYVSNGRLIWAAAALGLDVAETHDDRPDLLVGISEREHDYVRRMVGLGQGRPSAHHHRPPGFDALTDAIARAASGELLYAPPVVPAVEVQSAPFHVWLSEQASRRDPVGHLAADYLAGVRDHDHEPVRSPDDLLAVLASIPHGSDVDDAVADAVAEWFVLTPTQTPVRTMRIRDVVHDHTGWGAGAGSVERYEFHCPCGSGTIVEEHDDVPGFRDHDVSIHCGPCAVRWRLAAGRPVRHWGLVPDAPRSPGL